MPGVRSWLFAQNACSDAAVKIAGNCFFFLSNFVQMKVAAVSVLLNQFVFVDVRIIVPILIINI